MEGKMPEKFLPIGTVVLLNGGKKEVMITSYCIFPNNTEIKEGQEVKATKKCMNMVDVYIQKEY